MFNARLVTGNCFLESDLNVQLRIKRDIYFGNGMFHILYALNLSATNMDKSQIRVVKLMDSKKITTFRNSIVVTMRNSFQIVLIQPVQNIYNPRSIYQQL